MENKEMIEAAPILFRPYFKQVIWGGSRICAYKDCPQTVSRVGESWEISALPGRETVVASGTYKGMTLTELAGRFGAQLLGSGVRGRFGDRFPLLLKFIDANDNLSVQVHPDDATAMSRHNSPGKTEMWYVISAEPGAKVYVGLNSDMTPAEFDRRVADNTFTEVLAEHEVAPGDVFFLPPGRVHAIGAGVLLAEIQESSDTTYRIYDYGRCDSDGCPRELHTDLAREAIDYSVTPRHARSSCGADGELAACEYFRVRRLDVDGELPLNPDSESFTVLMCVVGRASLRYNGGNIELRGGTTVLCPAVMSGITLEGQATVLEVRS